VKRLRRNRGVIIKVAGAMALRRMGQGQWTHVDR